MSIGVLLETLLLVILVGFSAFFSAAETALFSLSKAQLQRLRQNRPSRGEIIVYLLDHPRRVLSTILIGNTTANTAACILALSLYHQRLWLTIGVMIPTLLILGEILPKTFAIQNAERTVQRTARLVYWLTLWTAPLRAVLEKLGNWMMPRLTPETFQPSPHITQDEFRAMIEIGREQGVLQESERQMIQSIMTLGDKTVKDVMTPRVDLVSMADDLSREEMTAFLRQVKHRRVPVHDGTPDTIVGILDVKKFLMNPSLDITEIMDMPAFVPEKMNAAKLLKNFQQQKRQLAIVVDEFGGTEGLVTVEDIVEEIVGEVADEYDTSTILCEQLAPHRYLVSGSMRTDDLNEQWNTRLDAEGVDTIGGFVVSRLGRIPKPGEKLETETLTLIARRVVHHRVIEVEILRKGGT